MAALSACTAGPGSSSPPVGEASTPEPLKASGPTGILIGAETTDVVDENGQVLLSLRYSENGDEAVAAATSVLGSPNDSHHQEGSNHHPAMDGTSWGGFDIVVNRYAEEAPPSGEEGLYRPAFSVQASAATTAGGVSISSLDGTSVGGSFDTAAESRPENRVHVDAVFGVRSIALDLPTSFPGIIIDGELEMAYGTIAFSEHGSSVVTKIVAPSHLFSLA